MTTIKYKNNNTWSNLVLDAIYPVGSIFYTTNTTSPATLFGGTWSQVEGRMVLGYSSTYSTIGGTGGAATVTLTAAQSGVPAHSHGTTITQPVFKYTAPASHTHGLDSNGYALISGNSTGHMLFKYKSGVTQWTSTYRVTASSGESYNYNWTEGVILAGKTASASGAGTENGTTASRTTNVGVTVKDNTAANATSAHNNMPPYYVAYIWRRTA